MHEFCTKIANIRQEKFRLFEAILCYHKFCHISLLRIQYLRFSAPQYIVDQLRNSKTRSTTLCLSGFYHFRNVCWVSELRKSTYEKFLKSCITLCNFFPLQIISKKYFIRPSGILTNNSVDDRLN